MSTEKGKGWIVRVYRKGMEGWTRLVVKNAKGQRLPVRAVLREGFIVLPQAKARIALTRNEGKIFVPIQRRREAILVRGTSHSQAIVLGFRTEKECIDFAAEILSKMPAEHSNDGGDVNTRTSGRCRESSEDSTEVQSYIARLLTDQNFIEFAEGLESCVSSTEDLKLMIEALSKRS